MHYIPFKPIKGQTFTFYHLNVNSAWVLTMYISKDGGAYQAITNQPVVGSHIPHTGTYPRYVYPIVLTADEMDADIILAGCSNADRFNYTIYTVPAELAAAPTSASSQEDKINAIYEYFFNKRTMTDSAMTLYKEDGTTELGSATVSDDGTTVVKGKVE